MKVAYLASLYLAPSHTFIQREILELQKRGVDIVRFSVRRARNADQLDQTARSEARKTRSLLAFKPTLLLAILWLTFRHPRRGFDTLRLALRSANDLRSIFKWSAYFIEATLLAYWMDMDSVQHLHCHFGNAGSNTAWLAAKLAHARLSITFHGIDLDKPKEFRHQEKLADAAFAVCISDFGQQLLTDRSDGQHADKVALVRCGYPVPDIEKVPDPPGRNQIICVARLSPEKGHMVLLQALHILRQSRMDFHCTLVGSGPLQQELAGELTRLDLTRHVTMAGYVPNAEVETMIANSDVSVLASHGEGIPIALLESLAWERPYVATRVGGIAELTPDGASGILVEPGDAPALAQGLRHLLSDTNLSRPLALAGRALVADQHDPARAAQAMLGLFRSAERDQTQ